VILAKALAEQIEEQAGAEIYGRVPATARCRLARKPKTNVVGPEWRPSRHGAGP
jgi:hypothetical protein